VRTEAEARRAVDALATSGVDFIKVHEHLGRETYFAAAAEARRLGVPFAGHIPSGDLAPLVTAIEASEAGQACIEHLNFVPFGEEGLSPDVSAAFRRNGTWVDPTLSPYWVRAHQGAPGTEEGPTSRYVAPSLKRRWAAQREGWAKGPGGDFYKALLRGRMAAVRALRDAGVPLLAGTDVGFPSICPGSGLHDELGHLVEAGLTPMEAIRAATSEAARYLGREKELGTVEPGKRADLVLLDADPLADLRHSRRIRAVVLNGRLFDRGELDGLLAGAASVAARP